jgi:Fe-S-cluster containining protein
MKLFGCSSFKRSIDSRFISCFRYFEKNTFQELIAEFKPMLCPTSPKMVYGLEMMKHFLPFLDPDAEQDINDLIVQLIGYCDGWNNHSTWEWVGSMIRFLQG